MLYSDDLKEEVRLHNDIVEVVSGYVKLQRKGNSYFGLCPFHNEKSPSFSVSPQRQMYYCFGCGAGGDVFGFIQQYENCTFPEAMKTLADRAGIALPEQGGAGEDRKNRDLRTAVLKVNKMAAKYYYYLLRTEQGARAMAYLKDRGLTDETIRSFGLGYAGQYSNSLGRYLKQQGISDSLLRESGLVQMSEKQGMYDKFWNRVMFPIMDVNSRVIGFGGRVMGDAKPKYLNSPETVIFDKGRNLYGLHAARHSRGKNLLVCEGYMDVIAMHQAGFTNSVASLGTALTSQHASLLKRYTGEVILTYDSDEAGVRAALRAIPLLREAGIMTRVLHMEPYKDPDEFIKALGREAFRERIDQAQNSFMFEISVLEKSYDLRDPEGKTRFFREAARKIAEFEQEIERENYIEAIASKYQVSLEGLRKMVMGWLIQGAPIRKKPVGREQKQKEGEGILKSERLLLSWLAQYPKLYPVVSSRIAPEDFSEGLYRQTAQMLYRQLASGNPDTAQILGKFEDPEQQKVIAGIFSARIRVESTKEIKKAILESMRKIMQHAVEERGLNLDPADIAGLQKLVAAKREIQALDYLHISL